MRIIGKMMIWIIAICIAIGGALRIGPIIPFPFDLVFCFIWGFFWGTLGHEMVKHYFES
jgi:hypothetical protein